MKKTLILEGKVCTLIPTQLGAIENQGGLEEPRIGEAIRNHRVDH